MIFSPGIYEHSAALIHRSPWEVSRSAELLFEAHHAAWDRYRHPLIVAGIDVYNLEAEACGAVVDEPRGNNVPAISRHPCAEADELAGVPPLDPLQHARIRGALEAGRALRAGCPGADVRIPLCGPFTLGVGLVGLDELLMGLVEDRAALQAGLEHLLQGQLRYLEAIHAAGLRPIIFESGTAPPLLPVRDFTSMEAPLLKRLFDHARALSGESPPCIIGGDAARIARPLLEAGPGFVINPSETDQAAFMEAAMDFPGVHVRVNIPAAVLLDADFPRIRAAADAAIALAGSRANTSVGCGVVPFEALPETLLRLRDHVAMH
jgi:uroporphyrinogen-III decarboxylase